MHHQFAVEAQHHTHAVQATKKASEWAAVAWPPKPSLAITEGTCQQWSLQAVPHWECQTLQCGNCKEYPVPKTDSKAKSFVTSLEGYAMGNQHNEMQK
jgi:hypothetical protein